MTLSYVHCLTSLNIAKLSFFVTHFNLNEPLTNYPQHLPPPIVEQ